MNENLQEFVDGRGIRMRVDSTRSVIEGVKILGLESRNGRRYSPDALSRAAALYENAKVNVNHPSGHPLAPRDYRDRIGMIRNVSFDRESGIFADFFFNPKHALSEQLIWDAQHAPQSVGFSHNIVARTVRLGDEVLVEAITKVQSVDLVADPATTRGLFESTRQAAPDGSDQRSDPIPWTELTVEQISQHRPDLVDTLSSDSIREVARLEAIIEELREQAATTQKTDVANELLQEYGLLAPTVRPLNPTSVVSQGFLKALLHAADEIEMRELVADRATLVSELSRGTLPPSVESQRPSSLDQTIAETAAAYFEDGKAFAKAIT